MLRKIRGIKKYLLICLGIEKKSIFVCVSNGKST
jgi:hypothetical protein